jgi:hypothetical protein
LIDDSGLLTKKPGFSFINVQGEFYGFPVQSFVDANGYPVVVQAGKEEGVMTLSVTASGLTSGTNYVLEQDDMLGSIENLPFTATGTTQTWSITADCLQVAKFTVIQDG